MAFIKKAFFHKEAYHQIVSYEYHKKHNQVRIRTHIFPNKSKESIVAKMEYKIIPATFIDNCRLEAEKAVKLPELRKIINKKIAAMEKKLKKPLIKKIKDMMFQEKKDYLITEKMKEIGEFKARRFFEDLNDKPRKTMSVLYTALKDNYKDLSGAIDI